jgi:hypothetical protein
MIAACLSWQLPHGSRNKPAEAHPYLRIAPLIYHLFVQAAARVCYRVVMMLDRLDPSSLGRRRRVAPIAALAFLIAAAPLRGQEEPKSASAPLAEPDRADAIQRVLTHPEITAQARGHRLVAIRSTASTTVDAAGAARTILTVVLFDHTALEARRVEIDAGTNRVVRNERLPGRPQSSRGEVAEAITIIRRAAALARRLDDGAVLDGGFIVDDPAGSRRRMLQFKMMTADRRSLIQTVTVDLTRGQLTARAGAAQGNVRP